MKKPARLIVNPQLIDNIRKCRRTTARNCRHEENASEQWPFYGKIKRTSQEILNCSMAGEAARQKLIAVGEHAGKLSNSRALMNRCDQCRYSNRLVLASFIDCFRATQACQLAGAGFASGSDLLVNTRG